MRYLLPALFLISLPGLLADDFTKRFETVKKAGDQAAIEEFLAKAATDEAENPDYYAAAGNYWWGVAGAVAMPPIPEGDFKVDTKDLSITDPKTGKKVGSIRAAGEADPEIPKRALGILTEGAKKFPQRADIALGLAYVQKEMGIAEGYVKTLTSLLAEAKKDPEALRWMEGAEMPEAAETFLPETVQDYTAGLFNANTPATDVLCGKLLAAVTDAFPDHPYAYNLKAALADATGKPEEALRMLEIAVKKAPNDALIIMNLADAYAKAGKRDKAAENYRKIISLDEDPQAVDKARSALKKLESGIPLFQNCLFD